MLAHKIYYRRLIIGSVLILGMFFLLFLAQSPDLADAGIAILFTITMGIWLGISMPGVLLCVMTSSCLMGYGLLVRKRYALMLFWSGFVLFFLAGMMGLGARY
ncbi:MAG: hypothetical protein FWF12_02715 [Betaproteobacteria bacterium]|nr:hypothetical protein [Betaproteobacteria bacterium]